MFMLGPHEFIVGLGSNSPHAITMLRQARHELRAHRLFRLLSSSPIYESDALLPPHAPVSWNQPYLNAACLLEAVAPQSARLIVEMLKELERSLGRAESPRWAPRPMDLDLLAWGGPDIKDPSASVPHPGLAERPFALLPAQDCVAFRKPVQPHPWRYSHHEQVPQKTRPSSAVWPEIVGVLNLTLGSFSDGGSLRSQADVECSARRMIADGATVLDIGAESTRPGANPVSWQEEVERLESSLSVLSALKRELHFKLSLDSRHPETVSWCLEKFPLDWINDVEGFSNPKMLEIAARSECDLVLMHSLGIPPRQDAVLPPDRDPIAELLAWGTERVGQLARSGISPRRIIFDPGIGFGKSPAQSLAIVLRARELNALATRLLMGHSRKRFLDLTGTIPASDRDLETALVTARIANSGVDYVRVHSPGIQSRALRMGSRLM